MTDQAPTEHSDSDYTDERLGALASLEVLGIRLDDLHEKAPQVFQRGSHYARRLLNTRRQIQELADLLAESDDQRLWPEERTHS